MQEGSANPAGSQPFSPHLANPFAAWDERANWMIDVAEWLRRGPHESRLEDSAWRRIKHQCTRFLLDWLDSHRDVRRVVQATLQKNLPKPSALAVKMQSLDTVEGLRKLVAEIACLLRSQAVAVFGNLIAVVPAMAAISLLILFVSGAPLMSPEKQSASVTPLTEQSAEKQPAAAERSKSGSWITVHACHWRAWTV